MATQKTMSRSGTTTSPPLTAKPITITNTPAMATRGMRSAVGRARMATTNSEKATAQAIAMTVPNMSAATSDPPTMTATPIVASPMAAHVVRATRSRSSSHASSATMNGWAARMNRVLATVVLVSARMNEMLASPMNSPAATPDGPSSRKGRIIAAR